MASILLVLIVGAVGSALARLSGPAAQRRQMSGYPTRSVEYVRAAPAITPPPKLCVAPTYDFSSDKGATVNSPANLVALASPLTNLLERVM